MYMERTNLFELYRNEISGNESVLDVGCGRLEDLVCFEDGPFKVLYGVDRDMYYDYELYRLSRFKINQKKPLGFAEFQKRYKLERANIENYDFGINCHNFIICRNLVHFFPDTEKFDLIERMYVSLAAGGLLYLQLHHTDNQDIINSEKFCYLERNVYARKDNPNLICYLMDHHFFIEELRKKYVILKSEIQINEHGFWFVIKK